VLTGPFLVFGTFLLLVALVRWGQRGVAATTAGLILAAIVPAAILTFDGAGPDPMRFMRGVICMIVVSMLMLWLASRQRGLRVVTLPDPAGAPGPAQPVLSSALRHACITMGARGAALAVAWGDEPWIDLLVEQDGADQRAHRTGRAVRRRERRCAPDAVRPASRPPHRHGRRSPACGRTRPCACRWRSDAASTKAFSPRSIRFPARASCWSGAFRHGRRRPALDERAGARNRPGTRSRGGHACSAVAEVRNALARDLHDSVVQFLAGTMFRLEHCAAVCATARTRKARSKR
jgi:signal transduction histidine kinase